MYEGMVKNEIFSLLMSTPLEEDVDTDNGWGVVAAAFVADVPLLSDVVFCVDGQRPHNFGHCACTR